MSEPSEKKEVGCKDATSFEVAVYHELGDRLKSHKNSRDFVDGSFSNKNIAILAAMLATAGAAEVDHLISPETALLLIIAANTVGILVSFWWWGKKKLNLNKAKEDAIGMAKMEELYACAVKPSADSHKSNQKRGGFFFKLRHSMEPLAFGIVHAAALIAVWFYQH